MKKNASLLILLGIFIVLRLLLLFTSQSSLEGDPASMAVMAQNTYKLGELHFYIYGEPYVGASAFNAYLATIPFSLFGISDITYKLIALCFALIGALLIYQFSKHYFGQKVALISLVLITIPPFFFFHLSILGMAGYMETFAIFTLLIWCCYKLFYDKTTPYKSAAYLGLTIAFGWWLLEYVIAFLIFLVAVWYMMDKRFFLRKHFWVFCIVLLIGLSPVLYYNATNNFSNFKHFVAGTIIHEKACDFGLFPSEVAYGDRMVDPCQIFEDKVNAELTFQGFFLDTLLRAFGSWPTYLITLLLVFTLIYHNRKSIIPGFQSLLPFQKYSLNLSKHSTELLLFGFFVFWFLVYYLSGRSDPKHFSPIYPILVILLAIGFQRLFSSARHLGYALFIIMIFSNLVIYAQALDEPDIHDISPLVSFLQSEDITHVYTDHPTKWKLLFYTNEEIIPSCNLCPCVNQYPRVEQKMQNTADTAYILWQGGSLPKTLASHLAEEQITYRTHSLIGYQIFYDLSEPIDTSIFGSCNWLSEQWRPTS